MSRIGLTFSAFETRPAEEIAAVARIAEDAGYELFAFPEAWGRDAFAVLAYVAARTSRIGLATGIVNVFSRSPAAIAMAAATLDEVSGGRFVLGLGVSGERVIEGWHQQRFDRPLRRLREVTEAVRYVLARGRRGFAGELLTIAPGFALTFAPPRERLPVFHASLTPAGIRQAAEVADGWFPYLVTPEALAADRALAEGALAGSGRARTDFAVAPFIPAHVGDDLGAARLTVKRLVALYVGGMGRFYREAATRHGFGEAADRVRALWEERRRDDAVAAVPDDLVDRVAAVGPAARARERIASFRAAGADLPMVAVGAELDLETIARTIRALADA